MKIKLITTTPNTLKWKSLDDKLSECTQALNTAKNGKFSIDVEYLKLQPTVTSKGRIDENWLDTLSDVYYKRGYDIVALHMSDAQRHEWSIKPRLRGSYTNDKDLSSELYFWADERTQRNGLNQFVETFLHEVSHVIADGTEVFDMTHIWHDTNQSIKGIFSFYDMDNFLIERTRLMKKQISLLQKIIAILTMKKNPLAKKALIKPLPMHWHKVTQPYLNPDRKTYPMTGVHIGTDFATPEGTEILAPADGEITRSDYSPTLGYWVEFKFGNLYLIALHLKAKQSPRAVSAGSPIGTVGNTGKIDGIHSHLEVWTRPRAAYLLSNVADVKKYTKDPLKVFV